MVAVLSLIQRIMEDQGWVHLEVPIEEEIVGVDRASKKKTTPPQFRIPPTFAILLEPHPDWLSKLFDTLVVIRILHSRGNPRGSHTSLAIQTLPPEVDMPHPLASLVLLLTPAVNL